MVNLWGRRRNRDELLARLGRLEQLAGAYELELAVLAGSDAIEQFTARTLRLAGTESAPLNPAD